MQLKCDLYSSKYYMYLHEFFFPKVLYEYIFSTGKIEDSFSLYTSPPKHLLPLSDTQTLQDHSLTVPTVVMVEESDQDVEDYLFPPATPLVLILIAS